MDITINQITPRRENGEVTGVQVHLTARTADGLINLNGAVKIDNFVDFLDIDKMNNVVKQKLVEQIMNGGLDQEPEE